MANKYSGFSAKLQVTISSVLTDIAGIRNIEGPSMALNTIDVSSRDNQWMEFVAGMRDAGEIKLDLVYDPDTPTHSATTAGGFIKDLASGAITAYKIFFADTSPLTGTFSALVTKVTPKAPYNGMQSADVTFKVTSSITWA
jgi:hypothetical protein